VRVVVVSWRDLANPLAGGAEVLVDRLLSGLASRGHDVALVCGGPVGDRDYPVIPAGGTFSQYVRAPVACATRFHAADVVVDVENGLPYFSPLWRRRPSVCLVHHLHTDQWRDRFPRPLAAAGRVIESRVMPAVYRSSTFVAVSASTAASLRQIGVADGRIQIVESGVDLPLGKPAAKSKEPLFLSLSRLVPHKRIDLIVRAWERVAREVPGRLVIAGDGPESTALRRLAATVPRVHVAGRVPETEKERLLGEAWALVSAAHHEGWGMSVMEAAAHGTPTLALDAPGIRDSIVDDITGILVPASEVDAPAALARAWMRLASEPERVARLGAAAREWAARFTWDRTIDRWLLVLQEAASSERVGDPPHTLETPPP
jgi:glycosyltransferase involved in cell wall biosynthesis